MLPLNDVQLGELAVPDGGVAVEAINHTLRLLNYHACTLLEQFHNHDNFYNNLPKKNVSKVVLDYCVLSCTTLTCAVVRKTSWQSRKSQMRFLSTSFFLSLSLPASTIFISRSKI